MKKKLIKTIALVVFGAVFLVSAVNIGIGLFEQHKTDSYNQNLQNQFVTVVGDQNTENNSSQGADVSGGEVEIEKPDDAPPENRQDNAPINIDFDALLELNEDIVGWLYCPKTPINYPVVKGEDNNEYLRKAIDGSYLKSGSLFVDYRNGDIMQDLNYIIYGHNTSGESMFGTLVKYKKQEYFDAHSTLYFMTPEREYVIELVSGNVIHRYSDFYKTNPDFSLVENLRKSSTFKSDVEIARGDKFVTLSTCIWDYKDARYVVIGKRTPIG